MVSTDARIRRMSNWTRPDVGLVVAFLSLEERRDLRSLNPVGHSRHEVVGPVSGAHTSKPQARRCLAI